MMKERRSSSTYGASFGDRKEHTKIWLGEPFHIRLAWSGCLSETKYLLLFLESSWQAAQNILPKLFFF